MEPSLREQFDLAVKDDPGADHGAMAVAAIAEGGRIRERRRRVVAVSAAAGVVAVLGAVTGVSLAGGTPSSSTPPVTIEAAMAPSAAPGCWAKTVKSGATDAVVFLDEGVTAERQAALADALNGDSRVETVLFDSRDQAYQRFRARWADEPDLVTAVAADQFPQSYRVRLSEPDQFTAFRAEYASTDGVQLVIGRKCPASAPVGGVL
ncbi:permease-like cell division protein FtsX [Actinoplanes sp. NPDC051851]|uniref:permease-like cell division protein FtsX n=1 Tax=Actinoplanes sp. NPDC051851 TaxID=3154753 RepID=UPI00341D9F39